MTFRSHRTVTLTLALALLGSVHAAFADHDRKSDRKHQRHTAQRGHVRGLWHDRRPSPHAAPTAPSHEQRRGPSGPVQLAPRHDPPRPVYHAPDGYREIRTRPRVVHGTTYVPLREVFGPIGCHVAWDPALGQALICHGPRTVIVTPGSPVVIIQEGGYSQEVDLGVAPVYYQSALYVPIRPVAQGLNLSVAYHGNGIAIGGSVYIPLG